MKYGIYEVYAMKYTCICTCAPLTALQTRSSFWFLRSALDLRLFSEQVETRNPWVLYREIQANREMGISRVRAVLIASVCSYEIAFPVAQKHNKTLRWCHGNWAEVFVLPNDSWCSYKSCRIHRVALLRHSCYCLKSSKLHINSDQTIGNIHASLSKLYFICFTENKMHLAWIKIKVVAFSSWNFQIISIQQKWEELLLMIHKPYFSAEQ